MKNRAAGFSLIELIVVVAIVGIIAAVAVPGYNQSVRKSHRSDATGAISEAAAMQERIYTENSSYTTDVSRLVINSDGSSSRSGYYTISVSTAACSGPPYNCYAITATATGAQSADTDCASFTLDHLGRKSSSPSSVCWQ